MRTFCLWPSASKPGASTPSTRKSSPFLPSRSSSPTMRRASCVTGVFWVSIVFSYLQALIDRRERHNIGIVTLFMLPTLDCEQRGGGAGEHRRNESPPPLCSPVLLCLQSRPSAGFQTTTSSLALSHAVMPPTTFVILVNVWRSRMLVAMEER